jgi:predicted dehydrogenase
MRWKSANYERMRELSDIGVAVIGTGFMGRVHVEALRRLGVSIRGILGSSAEKSRAAAAEFGLARGYETLDELLTDPAVQAVHVNTPNRFHLPQAAAAILAGKHVMCEKPLAMDSRESAELMQLSREHPELVTAVNYNNRFYPLCHEAREIMRSGEVGRIFHITGSISQDWLLYETDYNWRVLAEEGGRLRALSDLGSHWLDLIHFITGLEIEAVLADCLTVHPVRRRPKGEVETFTNKLVAESRVAGAGGAAEAPVASRPGLPFGPAPATHDTDSIAISTDDYSAVLIHYAGGARGSLWLSQVSPGRKCSIRFEIAGQDRTLAWDSEHCEELWIGRRDASNKVRLRDPAVMHNEARAINDYPGGHAEGYPDTFKQCFRAFYRYIAEGNFAAPRPFATFPDGHRDNVLCDAFVESAERGTWVRPNEI